MYPADHLSIDTPEQIALQLPLAGIGSRFLALAFDTLLQVVIYVVLGIATIIAMPSRTGLLRRIPFSLIPAFAILAAFCVYWGYFAFFESIWSGQTPGKRHAGIRVIKDSGRPITALEAIGRNLMRAIDGIPGVYGVGIICMMLNQQHRRLGDYVAGTVVVHEKKTEKLANTSAARASAVNSADERQITAEELMLVETYLLRRSDLDLAVRSETAAKIAARIVRSTGAQRQASVSDDDFLEAVARKARDFARFQ